MIRMDSVKAEDILPGDVMGAENRMTGEPFACLVYSAEHTSQGVQISFLSSNAIGQPTVVESGILFEYGTPVSRITQVE